MKRIVFYRKKESEHLIRRGICDREDLCVLTKICDDKSLETTIQKLQIESIILGIYPYFEKGWMVLNTKTHQKQIIYEVDYEDGIMVVYNHDYPQEFEKWNLLECKLV